MYLSQRDHAVYREGIQNPLWQPCLSFYTFEAQDLTTFIWHTYNKYLTAEEKGKWQKNLFKWLYNILNKAPHQEQGSVSLRLQSHLYFKK